METQTLEINAERLGELRQIVADVLEREPEEIRDSGDFQKEYDADSMRAIEILSRLEKKYRIEIPQTSLPEMQNLLSVYDVMKRCAGW